MSKHDGENVDLNIGAPRDIRQNIENESSETINRMDASINDLSSLVGPSTTNEELVARLISLGDDKLIPWEECHLPSKGIYYNWPDGMVMVRAMGQTAEKVLATQRLAQSGQSIDYLFRECIRFPEGFDPVDLLLGDRVFLLYYIRGITHGNMYEFAITCPNTVCNAVTTHSYDLNELSNTIKWAKSELGAEPFRVNLPYMSKALGREFWVGIRHLRGYDANDILAKKKMKKKMFAKPGGGVKTRNPRAGEGMPLDTRRQQQQSQALDDSVSENMNKIIVSVMGVTDTFSIRQIVDKLHATDTAAIREWMKENTPGIDNTVTVECPECGQDFTVELPITESFFRPSKQ